MRRYKLLAVSKLPQALWNNPKKCCEILMNTYDIGVEKVQFGLTKLFLRAGVVAQFETMRTQKLSASAIAIQKHWKRFYYERRYKKIRLVALYIQTCLRKGMARAQLGRLREDYAATSLQCVIRKHAQVVKYHKLRQAAAVLQKAILAFYAARRFAEMKLESAVTILQTVIRKAAATKYRKHMLYGTIKAQARWRGVLARRMYREMKIEARQISTIIAEKNKIEKKAEELQWRLSAEAIMKQKLEEENKKLEEKAKAAKEEAKSKETAFSSMSDKLAALEAQVKFLQGQLERERSENGEKEKLLAQEHTESARLRQEVDAEKQEKVKEKEAKEKVTSELEGAKEEAAGLKAKNQELEAEIAKLKEDQKRLPQRSLSRQISIVDIKHATAQADGEAPRSPPASTLIFGDNMSEDQIEAQNRNEPLKTALSIGGNEIESGKFLVDMVIVARGDDGPSQFVSGIPEPGFVIFKFMLRRELVPLTVDQKILSYLGDSFASSLQTANNDNDKLSFWMSNVAFLVYMVAKEIKIDPAQQIAFAADVVSYYTVPLRKIENSPNQIFHSTISQFHYGSPSLERQNSSEVPQVASGFFGQLKTLLVKIYTCLFRNVTAKISPLLHEALFRQNAGIDKMENITNYLNHLLSLFQQNFVYISLVQQFFEQIFFYINCVIFNEILLRRDMNSLVRGLELKMKIAELESWAASTKEWVGAASQQLKHTHQTISILMINKTLLESAEIRSEICPDLTPAQVAQLLSLYTPDPDSFEEPIPIRVRQTILKSSNYHPDDRLLLDPAVLRPFPISILHYLEIFELDRIPYASTVLVTALMKMNISNKMPKVVSDDSKIGRVRSWSVKSTFLPLKGSKN